MRSISKRIVLAVAVFTLLSTQSAFAARGDDSDFTRKSIIQRAAHFIVFILGDGELGWPKP